MAHFAKIGTGNIVEQVVIVDNSIATNEQNGIQFLKNLYNDPNAIWVQTSYNTRNGVHLEGGTPLRKNYAGIGYTYDETRDAFIPIKKFDSWIFDENTCSWKAPVDYPITYDQGRTDQNNNPTQDIYKWDELNRQWISDNY